MTDYRKAFETLRTGSLARLQSIHHDDAIMMARSQITLDAEQHKRARERAAALGISLAEYFRRLVAKDIAQPRRTGSPAGVFDLGDSGGSDVALQKDEYIGTALAARRLPGRRTRRKTA